MKIRVEYVRGFPSMKVINAETGEEVGTVLASASLQDAEKLDFLDTVAWLIGEKE